MIMKIMGFNLSWSLFDIDTTHNYTESVEFVDYDISINLEFEDIYIWSLELNQVENIVIVTFLSAASAPYAVN